MSAPPVELRIGELAVDGYPRAEGERVAAAVQAELTTRLAGTVPETPPDVAAQTVEAAVAAAIGDRP